jgi:hypothetical protein
MRDLIAEDFLFVLVELGEMFETCGILGNEGTLLENGGLVLETLVAREGLDFGEELVLRNTLERIGDSVDCWSAGSSAALGIRDIDCARLRALPLMRFGGIISSRRF